MNRKTILILTIGILLILTGIWAYSKIDQFIKVDRCLDQGGRWNYETQECEYNETVEIPKTKEKDSLNGYNQLADEQNRKTHTISEYNTDLDGNQNIERPEKTEIINSKFDTTLLFKIWTLDPNGPHADFWFKRTEFYVVDYDGNGAMPYILNGDNLTVFYNDFIQKGKIVSVNKGTLKIHWNDSDSPTEYVEWKN
jgi:hypothetical protein